MELIATSMFGLEAVVKRELTAMGLQPQVVQPGSIAFQGDGATLCRANLELRTAERILICAGRFPAADFDQLFEQTRAIPWDQWIPKNSCFPVKGKSVRSQLSSVPACQRTVKKAIVEQLLKAHATTTLDETGPRFTVEVGLLNDQATLTIDTTGDGLHKRGYRPLTGAAPLRETLAAALVMLSFWRAERPFIDPFCGTGTIPIEAAMIARRIAPGLKRTFVAEEWPTLESELWQRAREVASAAVEPTLSERLLGTDVDERALKMARHHAESAGVEADIHFQPRSFSELSSKRRYGCVICNPPYGVRLGNQPDVEALYAEFPLVLRRLPTWSHYVLTAHPNFEQVVGQTADRRRKLYNGRIECQYYQFHGPRPPRPDTPEKDPTNGDAPAESEATPSEESHSTARPSREAQKPAFGGLDGSADRQAEELKHRLKKRARHLRKWPARGITCYRLYERDVPGIPLIVDRYEDCLHIAEVVRPHDRTRAQHADWLDLMVRTATDTLEVDPANVFVKSRERQRGKSQYERVSSASRLLVVREGGLRFRINLSDYLDTGLFLDHRQTRQMVREASEAKRVLNLFGYSGSFTVYAAAGGAASTTTVDRSSTYLEWSRENLELNQLLSPHHRRVRADAMDYLRDLDRDVIFDLAVVDPPTYSNSKDHPRDWEVQRDHVELLRRVSNHLADDGIIYFSTNFRRFKLADDQLPHLKFHEISRQTVPEDFRNRRIHRCWRISFAS